MTLLGRGSLYRSGPKSNAMPPSRSAKLWSTAYRILNSISREDWPTRLGLGLQRSGTFGYALERERAVAEMLRLREEPDFRIANHKDGELAASAAPELNRPLAAILNKAGF